MSRGLGPLLVTLSLTMVNACNRPAPSEGSGHAAHAPSSERSPAPPTNMQTKSPSGTATTSGEPAPTVTRSGDLARWQRDAEKRAKERLPEAPDKMTWALRLAPPFPAHWPLTGAATAVSYYAGAYAMGIHLRDGEYSAGLVYRIEVGTDGSASTTILADPKRELYVQGVRPLTGDEVAVIKKSAELEQALVTAARSGVMPDDATANDLRAYYTLWFKTNGIGRDIRKHHTEFAKWLELPD
ncbi:MAG: hypothetical protein R3B13_18230 [Polyangiaceae bacterium]